MKKEKVAYANGEFVNYKLETQKFIICAVSEEDRGTYVETTVNIMLKMILIIH